MKIEFSTDNDAFTCHDKNDAVNRVYLQDECIYILHKIAQSIACEATCGPILDVNGNKIGEWSL